MILPAPAADEAVRQGRGNAPGAARPAARRGACPSLLAPMRTGDGLLVRLPLAEPLSPLAAASLARAAARFGNGTMEISARGNLQLRGLGEATLEPLRTALAEAGIFTREAAVEFDLTAARDPDAVDPRPVAALVSQGIASIAGLGAKVSVLVDGGGRWTLASLAADIRLEACGGGWRVSIGGDGASARPQLVAGTAADAAASSVALLEAIAAIGPAARGRDLVGFASAEPAVASAANGDRGRDLHAADVGALAAADRPARKPFVGRALPSGGAASRPPLGAHRLGAGAVLVVAPAFGATNADALKDLAGAAGAERATFLAPAAGRTLAIGLPTLAACKRLAAAAAALGFVVDPADRRLAVVACAGRPACASGFVATRPLAAQVAAALPVGAGPVHVSGCAKRCARPPHAAAELVGGPDGPTISGDPAVAALLADVVVRAAR